MCISCVTLILLLEIYHKKMIYVRTLGCKKQEATYAILRNNGDLLQGYIISHINKGRKRECIMWAV